MWEALGQPINAAEHLLLLLQHVLSRSPTDPLLPALLQTWLVSHRHLLLCSADYMAPLLQCLTMAAVAMGKLPKQAVRAWEPAVLVAARLLKHAPRYV